MIIVKWYDEYMGSFYIILSDLTFNVFNNKQTFFNCKWKVMTGMAGNKEVFGKIPQY